jgi:hypothetical protein
VKIAYVRVPEPEDYFLPSVRTNENALESETANPDNALESETANPDNALEFPRLEVAYFELPFVYRHLTDQTQSR